MGELFEALFKFVLAIITVVVAVKAAIALVVAIAAMAFTGWLAVSDATHGAGSWAMAVLCLLWLVPAAVLIRLFVFLFFE